MQKNDLLLIIALPVVALMVALVFGVILPRGRRRRALSKPITVSPFGFGGREEVPPRPARPTLVAASAVPAYAPSAPVRTPPATPPQSDVPVRREVATGTDGAALGEQHGHPDQPHLRLESSAAEATSTVSESRPPNLKVHRQMDGTLQFLSGRLEVVEGRDVGHEVRFVRTPGTPDVEVTLGRSEGPQYRHVQLHEPTVSRLHAKMNLEGKRWRITNLSKTNPIVVNLAPLDGEGTSVVLTDGDRIEMGEVAFRFRAK